MVEAIAFRMLTRISALLVLVPVLTAYAQEDVTVGSFPLPPGKGSYFGAGPFLNQPPTFTLTPKSPGARNGKLWIRNAGQGLLIVGKVDGQATERAALLAKDHIEVWIATSPSVNLPLVGCGHQFGPVSSAASA